MMAVGNEPIDLYAITAAEADFMDRQNLVWQTVGSWADLQKACLDLHVIHELILDLKSEASK